MSAPEAITLDLNKRYHSNKWVDVRAGDVGTCRIVVEVMKDNQPADISGLSARFCGADAKGNIIDDDNCSVAGNKVAHVLNKRAAQSPGVYKVAYFSLYDGEDLIDTTQTFNLNVLPNTDVLGQDPAGPYVSRVEDMVSHIKDKVDEADGSLEGLQTQYEAAESFRDAEYRQAEGLRTNAYSSAESARQSQFNTKETARQASETTRQENETERVSSEAKRKADFADMIETAQGLTTQILEEGQYDPATGKPTITGTVGKIFLVPVSLSEPDDGFYEWMWINNKWEFFGTTNITIPVITTDEIDAVISDQSPQGDSFLNTTGLSYLWSKIKAWAKDTFAALSHKHGTADINDQAITTTKLEDGAVTDSKLATDISGNKITKASIASLGVSKPDGTSITIDEDGTMHSTPNYKGRLDISQYVAMGSGFTLVSAIAEIDGRVCQLMIQFVNVNGMSAGISYQPFTLDNKLRPSLPANAGSTTSNCAAQLASSNPSVGHIRQFEASAAGATRYFQATYVLANEWTG